MPNHITSILTIRGDRGRIEDCLAAIRALPEDKNGERAIDFNKITPRPDDLDITADGFAGYFENQFSERAPISQLKEGLLKASDETIENFCKAVRNLQKHGFPTWYGWSCKHWGTKWNAYDISVSEDGKISFDTAWCMPKPIFNELSLRFPDLEFDVEYADEDIGSNCGHVVFRNGQEEHREIGDAEKFAKRVKGVEDDEDELEDAA